MKTITGVNHLLVDLDGTLLGAREIFLKLDFIAQVIHELKGHRGRIRAFRALWAMDHEMRELHQGNEGQTNNERAVTAFSEALDLPRAEGEKILYTTMHKLFPTLKRHFFPVPGASDFLNWAKGRFPLYLATNPVWPLELVKLRLEWAGVNPDIFQFITHAENMHACKPHARYYDDLLRHTGLRAEDCLLVGDSLLNDLAATSVGIRTFILSKRTEARKLYYRKARAEAWKGSFKSLRQMLETPEYKMEDAQTAMIR